MPGPAKAEGKRRSVILSEAKDLFSLCALQEILRRSAPQDDSLSGLFQRKKDVVSTSFLSYIHLCLSDHSSSAAC